LVDIPKPQVTVLVNADTIITSYFIQISIWRTLHWISE